MYGFLLFFFEPWLAIKGKEQGQGHICLCIFAQQICSRIRLKLELLAALPQRLEKTLCRPDLLPHVAFTRSQCHTAAAEGAKLSTIRRAVRLRTATPACGVVL